MAIRGSYRRNFRNRLDRIFSGKYKQTTPVSGSENIGKYNEHGEQITEAFRGEVFNTRDEALDKRYSYSDDENVFGVLGNKRKNIFGN